MAEDSLPSNVHVLKPRASSLLDRLDEFLEKHALAPKEKPIRCDPTRPKAPGINAIGCTSCGQAEYLTRDYCRCGHYLRGQLEDEFLAWAGQIAKEHDQLVESVAPKMRKLRYMNLLSLPLIVVPLIYLAFFSDALSVFPMVWMMVGVAIMAACASAERHLRKPIDASEHFLNIYTFESFLEQRFFRQIELDKTTLSSSHPSVSET